ncbi:MAG: LPS assembly protein LptD [Bryobacteraceae bacterium]|jgi:LPS-assembly protein
MNQWLAEATNQESDGKLRKLRGNAWVEDSQELFQADQMDWNEETGDVSANGHVYFHDFVSGEELWCDHMEYNTDQQKGKFYSVRGQYATHIVPRPGVLTGTSPFYFQGEWAERNGSIYTLHDGFFTNCKMPAPWWKLRGPKFLIEPGSKAIAYRSRFLLRGLPLFYTPYFYHSLEKEPRKSGLLLPNIGNSSQRGLMLGFGYYWAINPSYDATYRIMDYASRGLVHHLDVRGDPRPGTDFYGIFYGVQDRGRPGTNPPDKYSGLSVNAEGKSELGDGWNAHVDINYITSFRFRQEWTQSYNELVGSEIHSDGFINKNFSAYTLNIVFSRLENFQSTEVPATNPATGALSYIPNVVTIRKLPEAEFIGRDRPFWGKLPVWISFDSSAGLLYRSEPVFNQAQTQLIDHVATGEFMNRVSFSPRATGALRLGAFHLVPAFGLNETYYSQGQEPYRNYYRVTGTTIVRSAREFSLDLVFPSFARVYAKKTFLGDKLKHVIEPRVAYNYVTGVGSDFNNFIRFDETDLLSNTNDLTLSLTNRIYAKRGDSVQEVVTWELMQRRYFDPAFGGALQPGQRNVFESTADLAAYAFVVGPRGVSPVVSLLRISPVGGFGLQWQADYDPRMHGIVDSMLSIDYRWKKYFVSAGNNEVHVDPALAPAANQYRFRFGFGDPNHRGWNAGVDGIYDYKGRVIQYSTTQVTYNTDCCGFSVQYHRYKFGVRDEAQYRVAFTIANIGSFGTLRKQDRLF